MTQSGKSVGIMGAGGVAFGTAAILASRGHRPILWSPSGKRTKLLADGASLQATGALQGEFTVATAHSAEELASRSDVLMMAAPGYAHKFMLDRVAPHITAAHTMIFGSHCSFGALYLSKLLSQRAVSIAMAAWGTTIATSRQLGFDRVNLGTIRDEIDACGFPHGHAAEALALCKDLFGERFVDRGGLLSITLSNLNPQHHLGIGLCNMTRMEYAEDWNQPRHVSPNTGRLMEALDRERVAIADALGLKVRTTFEFFSKSYGVPVASVFEMSQEIFKRGKGGAGPKTAENRYAFEDVPFGLLVTVKLGDIAGVPASLHRAGVEIMSAIYGRNFADENDLLDEIGFDDLDIATLRELCSAGFGAAELASL